MDHTAFFAIMKNGTLQGAYLFHGVEEYVKHSALSQVVNGVEAVARDLNVQTLEAPDAGTLKAACETLPFFAERRVVICRDWASGEEKAFCEYLPSVPDTTVLLFYRAGKVDGRSSLAQTMKKMGRDVSFDPLSEQEAARWALQQARKMRKILQPPVARHLVEMVGTDVSTLYQELTKAGDYLGEKEEITREILENCVSRNIEYRLFDILDDLMAGRKKQGLQALYGILRERASSPIPAAALLAGQCRQMLSAKLLLTAGIKGEKEMAARMGCKPFVAKKALQGAKRYSQEQLKTAVRAFCDVDYRIKSGQAAELPALETAIWQGLFAATE